MVLLHSGRISADDPDALTLLQARLDDLQAVHAGMVQANKLLRRQDLAGLLAMGYTREQVDQLRKSPWFGYGPHQLQNSNNAIARTRRRIRDISAVLDQPTTEETMPRYRYREDTGANRVMFFFQGVPPIEWRTLLKRKAFRWAPSVGAWQRQFTASARVAARELRDVFDLPA